MPRRGSTIAEKIAQFRSAGEAGKSPERPTHGGSFWWQKSQYSVSPRASRQIAAPHHSPPRTCTYEQISSARTPARQLHAESGLRRRAAGQAEVGDVLGPTCLPDGTVQPLGALASSHTATSAALLRLAQEHPALYQALASVEPGNDSGFSSPSWNSANQACARSAGGPSATAAAAVTTSLELMAALECIGHARATMLTGNPPPPQQESQRLQQQGRAREQSGAESATKPSAHNLPGRSLAEEGGVDRPSRGGSRAFRTSHEPTSAWRSQPPAASSASALGQPCEMQQGALSGLAPGVAPSHAWNGDAKGPGLGDDAGQAPQLRVAQASSARAPTKEQLQKVQRLAEITSRMVGSSSVSGGSQTAPPPDHSMPASGGSSGHQVPLPSGTPAAADSTSGGRSQKPQPASTEGAAAPGGSRDGGSAVVCQQDGSDDDLASEPSLSAFQAQAHTAAAVEVKSGDVRASAAVDTPVPVAQAQRVTGSEQAAGKRVQFSPNQPEVRLFSSTTGVNLAGALGQSRLSTTQMAAEPCTGPPATTTTTTSPSIGSADECRQNPAAATPSAMAPSLSGGGSTGGAAAAAATPTQMLSDGAMQPVVLLPPTSLPGHPDAQLPTHIFLPADPGLPPALVAIPGFEPLAPRNGSPTRRSRVPPKDSPTHTASPPRGRQSRPASPPPSTSPVEGASKPAASDTSEPARTPAVTTGRELPTSPLTGTAKPAEDSDSDSLADGLSPGSWLPNEVLHDEASSSTRTRLTRLLDDMATFRRAEGERRLCAMERLNLVEELKVMNLGQLALLLGPNSELLKEVGRLKALHTGNLKAAADEQTHVLLDVLHRTSEAAAAVKAAAVGSVLARQEEAEEALQLAARVAPLQQQQPARSSLVQLPPQMLLGSPPAASDLVNPSWWSRLLDPASQASLSTIVVAAEGGGHGSGCAGEAEACSTQRLPAAGDLLAKQMAGLASAIRSSLSHSVGSPPVSTLGGSMEMSVDAITRAARQVSLTLDMAVREYIDRTSQSTAAPAAEPAPAASAYMNPGPVIPDAGSLQPSGQGRAAAAAAVAQSYEASTDPQVAHQAQLLPHLGLLGGTWAEQQAPAFMAVQPAFPSCAGARPPAVSQVLASAQAAHPSVMSTIIHPFAWTAGLNHQGQEHCHLVALHGVMPARGPALLNSPACEVAAAVASGQAKHAAVATAAPTEPCRRDGWNAGRPLGRPEPGECPPSSNTRCSRDVSGRSCTHNDGVSVSSPNPVCGGIPARSSQRPQGPKPGRRVLGSDSDEQSEGDSEWSSSREERPGLKGRRGRSFPGRRHRTCGTSDDSDSSNDDDDAPNVDQSTPHRGSAATATAHNGLAPNGRRRQQLSSASGGANIDANVHGGVSSSSCSGRQPSSACSVVSLAAGVAQLPLPQSGAAAGMHVPQAVAGGVCRADSGVPVVVRVPAEALERSVRGEWLRQPETVLAASSTGSAASGGVAHGSGSVTTGPCRQHHQQRLRQHAPGHLVSQPALPLRPDAFMCSGLRSAESSSASPQTGPRQEWQQSRDPHASMQRPDTSADTCRAGAAAAQPAPKKLWLSPNGTAAPAPVQPLHPSSGTTSPYPYAATAEPGRAQRAGQAALAGGYNMCHDVSCATPAFRYAPQPLPLDKAAGGLTPPSGAATHDTIYAVASGSGSVVTNRPAPSMLLGSGDVYGQHSHYPTPVQHTSLCVSSPSDGTGATTRGATAPPSTPPHVSNARPFVQSVVRPVLSCWTPQAKEVHVPYCQQRTRLHGPPELPAAPHAAVQSDEVQRAYHATFMQLQAVYPGVG